MASFISPYDDNNFLIYSTLLNPKQEWWTRTANSNNRLNMLYSIRKNSSKNSPEMKIKNNQKKKNMEKYCQLITFHAVKS